MSHSFQAKALASGLALGFFAVGGTAAAQSVTLQNDGWVDNTAAGFQGGFVSGEQGASVFVPTPDQLPVTLRSVRFLFGGDGEGQMYTVNIKVFRDTERTSPGDYSPGEQILNEEIQITSSTMAFNEIDFSMFGQPMVFDGPFRISIQPQHSGFPAIARDDDGGNDFPFRNYISAEGFGWVRSVDLLVQGDWVIRAIVDPAGATPEPDPTPDPNPGMMEPDPIPDPNPGMMEPDAPIMLALTNINPTEALNNEETDVTILGSGFDESTTFRVGSTTLKDVIIQGDGAALAVVPEGIVPGVYDVIANQGATEAKLSSGFTVRAPDVTNTGGGGGDCSVASGGSGAFGGLGLLLLGFLALRRRN